jgi:thioredoxin 1
MSFLLARSRSQITSGLLKQSTRFFADGKVTVLQSGQDLKTVMNDGKKVLYFTASWCPPCRAIKPLFEKLSDEFKNIQFVKIDIDENDKVAVEYKIHSVPTFVFINGNTATGQVRNLLNLFFHLSSFLFFYFLLYFSSLERIRIR